MILTEIQNYISKSHQVSLADMKLHFRMDESTLRPMLKKLVKKGRIRQLPITQKCDCCTCCHSDTLELYEWVGASDTLENIKIANSDRRRVGK